MTRSERLEEIRKRAATDPSSTHWEVRITRVEDRTGNGVVIWTEGLDYDSAVNFGVRCSARRVDVEWLLSEVERLEWELDKAKIADAMIRDGYRPRSPGGVEWYRPCQAGHEDSGDSSSPTGRRCRKCREVLP